MTVKPITVHKSQLPAPQLYMKPTTTLSHVLHKAQRITAERRVQSVHASGTDTYVTVTMLFGLYVSWSRKITLSTKWSMCGSSLGPRTYNIHLWVDGSFMSFLLPTRNLSATQWRCQQHNDGVTLPATDWHRALWIF